MQDSTTTLRTMSNERMPSGDPWEIFIESPGFHVRVGILYCRNFNVRAFSERARRYSTSHFGCGNLSRPRSGLVPICHKPQRCLTALLLTKRIITMIRSLLVTACVPAMVLLSVLAKPVQGVSHHAMYVWRDGELSDNRSNAGLK